MWISDYKTANLTTQKMSEPAQEILTIQKFVFLLNDFHYSKFEKYLLECKAALPSKLIDEIRKKLPDFDSIDELCKKFTAKTMQRQGAPLTS